MNWTALLLGVALIIVDAARAEPGPDREAAQAKVAELYAARVEAEREAREAELKAREITLGDKTMKWLERSFGDAEDGSRSLWISMHGGGGAPARVNDQQWQNQIRLYEPEEGIYVAPRAPTDNWNLWHEAHIDPLFARLIENMVALRGVDADKVYLMGYSAGGDGVWQLGPRMADHFAAAAMMAGHPNEAQLDGLRNLPFAIFMGGKDQAYDRNKVAAERGEQLAKLHKDDPGGYEHLVRIYPEMGHWMRLKDAEALPWMAKFTRRTWPQRVVWLQDDVTHDRFYWLQLPEGAAKKGQRIVAAVKGRQITLSGDVPTGTTLLLHDQLIDLDQPISVKVNDAEPVEFEVTRDPAIIKSALSKRLDPKACPTAAITLK
ncbi:dienelactone hydrolase family protein [Haloferula sp. A504]|uniref:dienelactone hydrolase family protein n=1 Tax=Haloferula sp. A504 TaxID=3373601 RepID=UPI0031C8B339|nr:dienelactone hydrolase family protein [Verrucomicrobiaceae bacterium E54]